MITANLHNVAKVEAEGSFGTSWLLLADDSGNEFAVFVPLPVAEAMAAAFNAAKAQEAA